MQYRNAEDRLNPIPGPDADETTLGGYTAIHGRAPGFDGSDGSPYTVALETEWTEAGSFAGYLIFVRWAGGGSAIMGHMDSDDLASGPTDDGVRDTLGALPLARVKDLLEELIARRNEEE